MKALKKLRKHFKKVNRETGKLVDQMDAFVSEHQLDATNARPELIEAGRLLADAAHRLAESERQLRLHDKAVKADKATAKLVAQHGKREKPRKSTDIGH